MRAGEIARSFATPPKELQHAIEPGEHGVSSPCSRNTVSNSAMSIAVEESWGTIV